MCEYITAILPKDVDLKKAEAVFLKHKRGFKLLDPYRIAGQLEEGDLYILTTSGICDCGTSLGTFADDPPPMDEEKADRYHNEQIKKLKAKGWSDSRIRRWLDQAAENLRKERSLENDLENEDILSWLKLIEELLESKLTSRISLLVHSYRTGIENERLPDLDHETISLKDLTGEALRKTCSDTIYKFTAR